MLMARWDVRSKSGEVTILGFGIINGDLNIYTVYIYMDL